MWVEQVASECGKQHGDEESKKEPEGKKGNRIKGWSIGK